MIKDKIKNIDYTSQKLMELVDNELEKQKKTFEKKKELLEVGTVCSKF
jgi:hypothetical protein